MKITWVNSSNAVLEVDETDYMMLLSALTMTLNYPLPFHRLQKEMSDGIELRDKVKQEERK